MTERAPYEPEQIPGFERSVWCEARAHRSEVLVQHIRMRKGDLCMFCNKTLYMLSTRGNRTKFFTQERHMIQEEP